MSPIETDDSLKARRPAFSPAQAVVKRRRYFSVVWIVPIVAAAVAGFLVFQRVNQMGPRITIRFHDGSGLKPGQSVIKYRGVNVGEVQAISLSADLRSVLVEARLARSAEALAREGSVFWIVRPEVSLQNVTGLGTIISGSYIEVQPGNGMAKKSFEGSGRPLLQRGEKGLRIVLFAPTRQSLRPRSPVYYRGIEVGEVQDQRLSADARTVEFEVFIQQRYAPLVKRDSKFWNVSGVDVDIGLFKGAQVNIESLKTLVSGGLAFATPEEAGADAVEDRAVFRLYEEPKKEWLEWAPAISIPENGSTERIR